MKQASLEKIIEEIKVLGYLWISSRSKTLTLSWLSKHLTVVNCVQRCSQRYKMVSIPFPSQNFYLSGLSVKTCCYYDPATRGLDFQDTQSVRMFVADGGKSFAAQSYAKNMKLYAGRVGALSIVCKTEDVASRVKSQLKLEFVHEWTLELKAMADRIINMQKQLLEALKGRVNNADQVAFITKEYYIYKTSDG
ncbi:hypothetical protein R6Q57_029236 [Mikania cordata]